jgi:chemotaxis protein methyltransferase CheR
MNGTNGQVLEFMANIPDFDVSKFDESFLVRSVQKRIDETLCGSVDAYHILLQKSEVEKRAFINSLRISYTEFFRNPLTFAILERHIFPELVVKKKQQGRKEIRIWSAACATGQEPYSLAMLLEELKNGDHEKSNYRIFATDQSESQVNEAKKGQYSAEAMSNLKVKRVNQWFTRIGEIYILKPQLRKNIDFSVFDLSSEQLSAPPSSIFGDFDIILCANILFYYKPAWREIMLNKMKNCLANGGYLVTGETERDILTRNNYSEIFPRSAIFQLR